MDRAREVARKHTAIDVWKEGQDARDKREKAKASVAIEQRKQVLLKPGRSRSPKHKRSEVQPSKERRSWAEGEVTIRRSQLAMAHDSVSRALRASRQAQRLCQAAADAFSSETRVLEESLDCIASLLPGAPTSRSDKFTWEWVNEGGDHNRDRDRDRDRDRRRGDRR